MSWIDLGHCSRDELALLVQHSRLLNLGLVRVFDERIRIAMTEIVYIDYPYLEHVRLIEMARRQCLKEGISIAEIVNGMIEADHGYSRRLALC